MLDNFKEIELHWDKVNQDFYQEINGVAGDTNGRRLKLYITDNGEAIDLTGNKVKFYWRYKFSNYNSITEFIATDITKGAFYFYIPTEMQSAGEIVGNIAIENAKDVSILISKEITIKISESQFGTSLEETKNKADAITTMILDAVPKDITESLSKKVDKTAIIDIAHGGTGNTSGRSTGLTYRQLTESTNLNTITDYACGTMYYLNNKVDSSQLPTGFSTYSQMITNNGTQLLINTTDGRLATRAIQNSVWSEWRVQLDWKNPTQVVGTDTTSTGTAYSITNTNLPKTLVNGYSFSFIPNISSTSQSATLSINGGTAYPFYKFDTYTGSIYQVASSNATSNFLQANVIYKTTYKNGVWIINDLPIPNVSGVNGTLAIGNGGTGNIGGYSYGVHSNVNTTDFSAGLKISPKAVGTNQAQMFILQSAYAKYAPADGVYAVICSVSSNSADGTLSMTALANGIIYVSSVPYTYTAHTATTQAVYTTTQTPTWTRVLDNSYTRLAVVSDSTSTGSVYTITNATMPKTLYDGYSFAFKPNITSTTTNATLAINGGTAYPFARINSYTGSKNITIDALSANFLQSAYHAYTLTFGGGYWIITEMPLIDTRSFTGSTAIANGGTGNIYGTASSTSITTGISSLLTFKLSAVGNTSRINLRTASSASGTPTTNTFDGTFACFPATTAQDGKFLVVDRTTGIWYAGTGQYTYLDGTWTNTTGNIYWTQIFDSGTTIPIKNGGTGNVISSSQSSSGIGVTINGLLKGGTIVGTQKLEGNYLKIFGNISNTTDGIPVSGTTFHCILTTNGTSTVSILAFDEWSGKAFSSNISGTYSDKTFTCGADVVWTDLSQQPVGGVVMNTSSTASGFTGTWSNIGNATIGSTVVYYWKKTA